jgi:hypothetical protein
MQSEINVAMCISATEYCSLIASLINFQGVDSDTLHSLHMYHIPHSERINLILEVHLLHTCKLSFRSLHV